MLPAIYFIFSRNGVRRGRPAVPRRRAAAHRPATSATASARSSTSHVGALDDRRPRPCSATAAFLAGLEAGVAAHHAGMVPPFKEAVEACFVEGLVKVVFATETLAVGHQHAGPDGGHREAHQVHRRAPRVPDARASTRSSPAGPGGGASTTVGYAVVLWSPFVPVRPGGRRWPSSRSFQLTSAFRPTYNMAANLVRRYTGDEAHHLLNLSFAQYQADRDVVRLEARLERRQAQLAELRGRGPQPLRRHRRVPPADGRADARRPRRGRRPRRRVDAGADASCGPGDVIVRRAGPQRRAGRRADASPTARAACRLTGAHHRARIRCMLDRARLRRRRPTSLGHIDLPDAVRAEPPRLPAGGGRAGSSGDAAPRPHRPGGSAAEHGDGRAGRCATRSPTDPDLDERLQAPRPGRAGRPRGGRPATADPGPQPVAGPPLRPGAARARGLGLRRRLGAHRRRAIGWRGIFHECDLLIAEACARACSTASTRPRWPALVVGVHLRAPQPGRRRRRRGSRRRRSASGGRPIDRSAAELRRRPRRRPACR